MAGEAALSGAAEPAPLLGVAASVTGHRWVAPGLERDRQALALLQATGLPDPVCRILAARGVPAPEAEAFLAPSLRELTPDPSALRDMDRAAELLVEAALGRARVAIFGDYDVDGASSSALLFRWLAGFGIAATIYIPDRIDEGYGPNVPAMERLARAHDMVICVDCGTLSHGPVAAARAAGAKVLILDHHLAGETLPEAEAVVNPNRQDEDGSLGHLCAAGVVFLLLVAANRLLRGRGRPGPDLMSLLDIVALATVADVAPLIGFNRALVRQGLKVMAQRRNRGLAALSDVARMASAPTSYHLGFLLGPRINAGGRVGDAALGARLLCTEDAAEASAIAERLEELNRARQEIEAGVLVAATAQAEARGAEGPLVWAAGEGWHPGVVGIVASRLKEAFNRPAIVIGIDRALGEGKGSGRSVTGVDLGAAIARLAAEGLLVKGGGHRMAAGLTVDPDGVEPAMERLAALLARQGAGQGGPADLAIDGVLAPSGATVDLLETLERAGPYGASAPAPRFVLPGVRLARVRQAGESHVQITCTDLNGGRLDGIAFRALNGPLGPFLLDHAGRSVHLAGRLEIDDWNGRRRAKLRVEDAAPADDETNL
ncbi:single-stranded-DNA-specific exonuclease RecJ [Oceanicella sp. SM1341]|uniref:single-stranded-DNA-specific exonuclease RecJ n=1 Tax=Oceanicella sp. SM1341 TaxID=1548889 RepID=UPI000E4E9151|nr:single-stranded-DNA-specific exonuclease RecJ [Oceanicella sp. SM1341]